MNDLSEAKAIIGKKWPIILVATNISWESGYWVLTLTTSYLTHVNISDTPVWVPTPNTGQYSYPDALFMLLPGL